MEFFSLRSAVERLIHNQFKNWISGFDESSLEIGLWNGDIKMNNLTLQPQSLYLGEGIEIKLEFGFIEEFLLQIPLSKVYSGNLSCQLNHVDILLKIDIDAHENQSYNDLVAKKLVYMA